MLGHPAERYFARKPIPLRGSLPLLPVPANDFDDWLYLVLIAFFVTTASLKCDQALLLHLALTLGQCAAFKIGTGATSEKALGLL